MSTKARGVSIWTVIAAIGSIVGGVAAALALLYRPTVDAPSPPGKDEVVIVRQLAGEIEAACFDKAALRLQDYVKKFDCDPACRRELQAEDSRICACVRERVASEHTLEQLRHIAAIEKSEVNYLSLRSMGYDTTNELFLRASEAASQARQAPPEGDRQRLFLATAHAGRLCQAQNPNTPPP